MTRTRTYLRLACVLATLTVVVLLTIPAYADDIYWDHDPATPGDWFDPLNWDPNQVPAGGAYGDNAYIDNGGTAEVNSGGIVEIRSLYLRGTSQSTLIQRLGSLVEMKYLYLGNDVGTTGLYELQDGEFSFGSTGGMFIGENGTGTFRQTGGILHRSGMTLGGGTTGSGTYELSAGQADLWAGYLTISQNGLFKQTGGTFECTSGSLSPAWIYDGGRWELSGTGDFDITYLQCNAGTMGDVDQKGGTAHVGTLRIGKYSDSGTFLLSGGELRTDSCTVGYRDSTGIFRQTGGTHVAQDVWLGAHHSSATGVGTYELIDGILNASSLYVGQVEPSLPSEGTFTQTGGISTLGYLWIRPNSIYEYHGGSLEITSRLDFEGTLDFGSAAVTMLGGEGSWLDFTAGTVSNAGNASLTVAPNTVTVVNPGQDLNTIFNSFTTQGILHTLGTTLDIPSGMTISTQGEITDLVRCAGVLGQTGDLILSGGLEAYDGAIVECSEIRDHIQVDTGATVHATSPDFGALSFDNGASGISDGTLSGSRFGFSGTQFTQSGGMIDVVRFSNIGAWDMSGGTLDVRDDMFIGNDWTTGDVFNQSGGTVLVGKTLEIDSADYILAGGTLTTDESQTEDFVQTGGVHSTRTAWVNGSYNMNGGNFEVTENMRLSGLFHHTDGTTTVGTELRTEGSGLLELEGGSLSCDTEDFHSVSGPAMATKARQSGGSNTANTLTVEPDAIYELSGGTLTVNTNMMVAGILDFQSGFGELHIGENGTANLSTGQILNALNASMYAATGTNVFFPEGFDPYIDFGTYDCLGITHLYGDPLLIAPGETVQLDGDIHSRLLCHGTATPAADAFNLLGGVEVHGSGYVDAGLGMVVVDDATSGITGGQLGANQMRIGTSAGDGTFTQDEGSVWIPGDYNSSGGLFMGFDVASTGTYILNGGTLTTENEYIGYSGTGIFQQSGGVHIANGNLIIAGYDAGPSRYEMSGGYLSGNIRTNGLFTHTGGRVSGSVVVYSFPDVPANQATYEISGTAVLELDDLHISGCSGNGPVYSYGKVLQDGPATSVLVTRNFAVSRNGTYDLRAGSLVADSAAIYLGLISQSGGTAVFQDLEIGTGGVYQLGGGSLSTQGLNISSTGTFDLTGGTLSIGSRLDLDGVMDWHSQPVNFQKDHIIVDFSGGGTVLNGELGHFELGSDSLLIIPSGLDPASLFGNYVNQGMTHTAGQTLVVPSGKGFTGSGDINDLVLCQGGNIHATSGRGLNLNAGLHLESGTVNIGNGTAYMQDDWEMTGGELLGGQFTVQGYLNFHQSGGTIRSNVYVFTDEPYLLSGTGLIASNWVKVRDFMEQTGGRVQTNTLYLEDGRINHDVWRTYHMTDGELQANIIYVGDNNRSGGLWLEGGNTVVNQELVLGGEYGWCGAPSGEGYVALEGSAVLTTPKTIIGSNEDGEFYQNGGTHNVGTLYVGKCPAKGYYELNDGTLNAGNVYVGSGLGSPTHFNTILQNGGTHTVTGSLVLAGETDNGVYDMRGGQLTVATLCVGYDGIGSFKHTAGMNTVTGDTYFGFTSGSQGTYNMSGTAELYTNNSYVGCLGTGNFIHNGGSHTAGVLYLGYESDGNGSYTISQGTLVTSSLYVGYVSSGTFDITDATANITISDTLQFGADSAFTAVPGSSIHMTGSAFENENTDPADLAGLANLSLIYDGHTGETDPFELAGEDLGRDLAGLIDNFALGAVTLEDAAVLQLVDDFDNAHRGGVGGADEALYLGKLTMLAGSTLDLNGLHLYLRDLDYQGGTILNGDLISLLPGDADGNWCVDGVDLATWQSNYDPLGNNPNTFAMGDWDGNGCIDGADLALWQSNYNPLGYAETTPEPGTMLLLGTGALCLAGITRRRLMN